MPAKDPRVDQYIEKAAPFAKPILKKLRALVHKGCPEVEETIKWGVPSFEYKGPFCGMAAFKQHCAFGFWKATILFAGRESTVPGEKTSTWGAPDVGGRDLIPARIASVKDLPADAKVIALIKKAKKLNDDGAKAPRTAMKRKPLPMPADFAAAIKRSKSTAANFEAFSPSCKREYVEWITEAKTDGTRERRMATAIEWIADGKHRNWKYQKKK